ncbi:MAG: hypothetical protein U9R75_01375 [Candidatus Thermoplasmatota archaeon]|nr:hypothetical protein [Candidatus Thermoplasmatota archaeon]
MDRESLEPSEIHLKIQKRSSRGDKYIPVDIIGNYLIKIQNLIFHCGEYLSEKPFRTRGQPSKDVVKRCRLLMRDANISSFDQHLVLGDDQAVIFGNQLGVESIQLCSDLFDSIPANDSEVISHKLYERVTENRYRNRLLRDLDGLIPKRSEGIDITFQSENLAKPIQLGYENKGCLSKLIKITKKEEISIIGILSEMRVTQGPKRIELSGPEGKIKINYPKEIKTKLLDLMTRGQTVNIKGVAKIREDETIGILEKIKDIAEIKYIERHRIVSEEFDLKLSFPLKLDLKYSDDNWIMNNDKLGIYSHCPDYNECLKEAESEFTFIYKEFTNTPDAELTDDARQLKNFLVEMVKEN